MRTSHIRGKVPTPEDSNFKQAQYAENYAKRLAAEGDKEGAIFVRRIARRLLERIIGRPSRKNQPKKRGKNAK